MAGDLRRGMTHPVVDAFTDLATVPFLLTIRPTSAASSSRLHSDSDEAAPPRIGKGRARVHGRMHTDSAAVPTGLAD